MKIGLVLAAIAASVDGQKADSPSVKVQNGTIQGAKCSSTNVNAFHSIPFAKPPIGELRFAPPQPWDQAYNGTLDATQSAPACPQFNALFAESTNTSEDCLMLDIWAPANATSDSKLPVKVWLYGGSNEAGGISDPLYDGCFASNNVLQVSINYRVGPLGFLAYDTAGLTGNYGIQDQLLALRWVQENIAAFGGDPDRVLLFGQSAGADDTWVISSLPQAESLIHAAIMESGSFAPLPKISEASRGLDTFVKNLNCSTTDLACLRSASLEVMTAAFANASIPASFGPVIDGMTLSSQPGGPNVPSIIGSTTNEGSLFVLGAYEGDLATMNQSTYDSFLLSMMSPNSARLVNTTYPISLFASDPFPALSAMIAVTTYFNFTCPARRLAIATANRGVPVWEYSFNHTPSCDWYEQIPDNKAALTLLGAAHTSEIPFVFGQVDNLPRPSGNCSFTAAEKRLSTLMLSAWDNMAAEATPGGDWRTFSANGSQGLIIEGDSWRFDSIYSSACDFWDKIALAESGNGTAGTSTATLTAPIPTATLPVSKASKHQFFAPTIMYGISLLWLASLLL